MFLQTQRDVPLIIFKYIDNDNNNKIFIFTQNRQLYKLCPFCVLSGPHIHKRKTFE